MSQKTGFRIIAILSLVTMLWSLYFSSYWDPLVDIAKNTLFQWPGLEPCHLCRWGRIYMYPIVLLAVLWLIRKNKEYFVGIGWLSAVGICIAIYHYYIQFFGVTNKFLCTDLVPCNVIQWQLWGFITLPLMEIIIFLTFLGLSIAQYKQKRK